MAIKTHKVTLSLDNPRVIQSGINVQSFDKQSIQISIELTKNDEVFQVPSDATIRISLLKLARQEQKIIVDVPNTNRESIDWIVPDYLDGYQGVVRVGVYLVSGTENVDLGYFTILSNVSDIDKMADEFTDNVFQGWEQIEADLNELNLTIAQTKLDLADDLTQIDNTIANINTLASDFTADVATKQADVTNKYNAFDTSVTTAGQTIDEILALQPQFQAVLDETTGKDVISAPEIILARNGEANLKSRLDKDQQQVTAQLAQTEQELMEKLKISLGSVPYGKIDLPDDFIKPEFNFWRDNAGVVQHDFDFERFRTGTPIYLDSEKGDDVTGDGTREKPYRALSKCINIAKAGTDERYKIIVLNKKITRGYGWVGTTITDRKISIIPDESLDECFFTNHQTMTYTNEGDGVYKTTNSYGASVATVFHLKHRDIYNVPIPFEYKTSLSDCQNTPLTFHHTGSELYLNLGEFTYNDSDLIVSVTQALLRPTLINSEYYVENIKFLVGTSGQDNRISGDSSTKDTSTFIANNCVFVNQSGKALSNDSSNSLEILNVSKTYLFGSIATYAGEDGFNYHYQGANIGDSLVVEVDCLAYDNGHHSLTSTSNATTAHEAIHVLRVRSVGYNAKGPVLADVNGCKTICIDCNMRDALVGDVNNKSAYYFYNSSGFPTGYAYLINCSGGGEDTLSANANDGFDIYLQAFRGFNFREGFAPIILS